MARRTTGAKRGRKSITVKIDDPAAVLDRLLMPTRKADKRPAGARGGAGGDRTRTP